MDAAASNYCNAWTELCPSSVIRSDEKRNLCINWSVNSIVCNVLDSCYNADSPEGATINIFMQTGNLMIMFLSICIKKNMYSYHTNLQVIDFLVTTKRGRPIGLK